MQLDYMVSWWPNCPSMPAVF